ncbi:Solute carrier family 17 member 5, variant 2 [Balamuthia mandrillaris]
MSITIDPMGEEYKWSSFNQGFVLSSFFIGYILTQIPGGWFASRFGGKWVYGIGILCTALLTLLTPIAAKLHIGFVIALRVAEGIGEGVTYPAMHAMFGEWAPPSERSRMVSLCYSGAYVGTIIAFPSSGALVDSSFLGGWPAVFYVYGIVGILWFVPWAYFIADSPAVHSTISQKEYEHIVFSLPPPKKESLLQLPWRKILMCLPFWAILTNHFANNWAFYTMLTWLPKYLKEVLGFDIKHAGFIAVLPYVAISFAWILSGIVADFLITRKIFSTTIVRKIFETLAFVVAGGTLLGAGYCHSVPVSVAFMTISTGFSGLCSSGFQVNHLDIAPNYAGLLMGLTNTAATIPGIVSPTLTGAIVGDDESDESRWQIVFWIAASIYAAALLFYLLFGSGKRQI